jgi:hypothetical protein
MAEIPLIVEVVEVKVVEVKQKKCPRSAEI